MTSSMFSQDLLQKILAEPYSPHPSPTKTQHTSPSPSVKPSISPSHKPSTTASPGTPGQHNQDTLPRTGPDATQILLAGLGLLAVGIIFIIGYRIGWRRDRHNHS